MSGDYVIHCSCGAEETLSNGGRQSPDTIESAAKVAPALEVLSGAGWEVSEMRGVGYDHAGQLVFFVLEHWRHGELSYSYNNNSDPPIVLKVPEECGFREPCPACKGRRLVPCPACEDGYGMKCCAPKGRAQGVKNGEPCATIASRACWRCGVQRCKNHTYRAINEKFYCAGDAAAGCSKREPSPDTHVTIDEPVLQELVHQINGLDSLRMRQIVWARLEGTKLAEAKVLDRSEDPPEEWVSLGQVQVVLRRGMLW